MNTSTKKIKVYYTPNFVFCLIADLVDWLIS
jgi:hypothetical protein